MFKSYGDYNFQQNQIINVVLHNSAQDPANGKEGQLYFNTALDAIKYHDGNRWRLISSSINMNANNGITMTIDDSDPADIIYTLGLNVNTAHLIIEPDTVDPTKTMVSIKDLAITEGKLANGSVSTAKIKDGNVTTDKIKDGNVTTIKLASDSVTFTKMQKIATMTVIGNMSSETSNPEAIQVLTDLNTASEAVKTLATSYAIKAYIDSKIAGLGNLIGDWDPSSGIYPGNVSTKKGDYWYVITEAAINGVNYNVGDVIIAKDNAVGNNVNQYITLETNRDKATSTTLGLVKIATANEAKTMTPLSEDKVITVNTLLDRKATETVAGIIELATKEEAEDATDTSRALTPKTGKDLFLKLITTSKYVNTFGTGATSYTVNHNLNNLTPQVTFYDSSNNMVLCPYTITNANVLVFTAIPAPTATTKITIAIS